MISIFIVEDNKSFQNLLVRLFQHSPEFSLTGAADNGKDALLHIPALQPDVVLMDIGLPDISGVECIARLKPQCAGTEFVAFTVSDEDEVVFEALKTGATSYLMKSTPPDELIKAIKEVHNGGSPISSDIARKIINRFSVQHEKQTAKKKGFGISKREDEMLKYLAEGMTYQEVADRMFISLSTLKSHIYNTYEKLQVSNKVEAINKYFEK
ncbi:MAG: response regulator transcription factor [Chitinophagaceae bacterium]|nr:response regulator transcription factor [Chitinophagaceae bacterium]